METAPRNCRFLSLVVVELVLSKVQSPKNAFVHLEKASAEIRGEFFRTKSRVKFAGDFLVDFFGSFSLEKNRRKNPPKNPRQNSNRNLGVSRPKSTLQGSGLEPLDPPGKTAPKVNYHARRKSVRSNSWGSKPDTDTDT